MIFYQFCAPEMSNNATQQTDGNIKGLTIVSEKTNKE